MDKKKKRNHRRHDQPTLVRSPEPSLNISHSEADRGAWHAGGGGGRRAGGRAGGVGGGGRVEKEEEASGEREERGCGGEEGV